MTSSPAIKREIPTKRRAMVLGGSDGIGLAVVRELLARDWHVHGISRSPSPIQAPDLVHTTLDVADDRFRATLDLIIRQAGAFDACIFCVGIGDAIDVDDLRSALQRETHTFRVNLMAAVVTAEVVLPAMRVRERGHFVVLSSLGDRLVSGTAPAYHASKAGLSSYFEGLSSSLRGTGIAITNVRLGFVDTKMAKSRIRPFMMNSDEAARIVVHALESRRARISRPLAMAILVVGLRILAWLKGLVRRS